MQAHFFAAVLLNWFCVRGILPVADKSPDRDIFAPLLGVIAQMVERLVRNEYRPFALTFADLLLSALS
jgi:hypothetical protein